LIVKIQVKKSKILQTKIEAMNQLQTFNNPEFGQIRMVEVNGKPLHLV
jgi:hypothetical protein